MDNETIKCELRKKGYTLAMMADALGCTPANVQQTCKRLTQSHRVANAIAMVIGVPVDEVFPDVPAYTKVNYFTNSRQQRVDELKQRLAS